MIFEIRFYRPLPGRIHVTYDRFENHLPRLFERHGIRNVGRWTAITGLNSPAFVYLVAYRDLAERERQWQDFYGDPDWPEVRALTQGDEEALERYDLFFLKANPLWSPPTGAPEATLEGVQCLSLIAIASGMNQPAYDYLEHTYLPAVERAGGGVALVADFIAGPRLPRLALLTSWPDAEAWRKGMLALIGDEAVLRALASQRQRHGRAVAGDNDTYLLEPTPFALPLAALGQTTG